MGIIISTVEVQLKLKCIFFLIIFLILNIHRVCLYCCKDDKINYKK